MKLPSNLGMMLLAIWLILFGLLKTPLIGLSFAHSENVLGVLAIVVGILLLLRR